jgi:hypothetical protein
MATLTRNVGEMVGILLTKMMMTTWEVVIAISFERGSEHDFSVPVRIKYAKVGD